MRIERFGRRSRRATALLVGLALAVAACTSDSDDSPDASDGGDCTGEPMFLTENCVDPFFDQPFLDVDLDDPDFALDDVRVEEPVPHYYLTGGFEGTDNKFSLYFPLEDDYEGRFFQFTHQLVGDHFAQDEYVTFALDSGGYLVQTNIGGSDAARSVEDVLIEEKDPSIVGYRANAAAAKYSREVANRVYDDDQRPYGYLSGGSGGAYQTIAGLQNSTIWDGGAPFIMGTPHAIPNVFTVRIHALRVLGGEDGGAFPGIVDAIEPGGSGDMYEGLDDEQRAALEEVTLFGFPPRAWFDHATLTGGALSLVAAYVPHLDADYFDDFWNEPGYLGYDDPSLAEARMLHETTVASAEVMEIPEGLPAGLDVSLGSIRLTDLPEGDVSSAHLVIGDEYLPIVFAIPGDDPSFTVLAPEEVIASVNAGDPIRVDNTRYLALQTYHRHQIPDVGDGEVIPENAPPFPAWDQYLVDGEVLFPQRDILVGPEGAFNGAGSVSSGDFHGKMIALQNAMDIDALAWQADWYRNQVIEAGRIDDFRLYFLDHADHGMEVVGDRQAHLVNFRGALEQVIRDLVAWVEDGVEPPRETGYELDGAVFGFPSDPEDRHGIQPVVTLEANGSERAEVSVGEPVTFTAEVHVPDGAGRVVSAEWDFLGVGEDGFVAADLGEIQDGSISLEATHTFDQPGTYFAVLRVTLHRDGDPDAVHARVMNLGRVRVVVSG